MTWNMPAGSGDRWPEDYERGRPGWPAEVVDVPAVARSATVLELGAGTGKLTRLLVDRFERVVALEPADAMRRLLVASCRRAEALAGTAQRIPLPDASVEAIFAAEAFHWFYDAPSLSEIARVLRRGGALVLMWNVPASRWEPSVAEVEELLYARGPKRDEVRYDPLDLEGPGYASGEWLSSFPAAPFEPLREARLANPQTLDRDGLVAYYASMGWLADLPDEERLPLLDEVRSRLTAPKYTRMWESDVHWTRLVDGTDQERPV